ncbi:energy transducer TonB [Neiella marina]|uniref:Energy transducer TonB n=1 Tax=Neiella holothuriorum TaxID=2870530 RepID=A0ABS7EIV9_9GAMM|nr:energy transducer TonB [Neiella holothuriorum]MBW8191587.1 energy transducer TonB [Neiella holothuriorum]
MSNYIAGQWPIISARVLLLAFALLGLFWVSADVVPAPMASPMGVRSAVSVQINMVAAPKKPTSTQKEPVQPQQTKQQTPEPTPQQTIAQQPPEPQQVSTPDVEQTPSTVVQPVTEPSVTKESTVSEAEPVRQEMPAESEPDHQLAVEDLLDEPVVDDHTDSQSTQIAANNQASGAHQEPVFVQPLFAAPPSPPRYPTIARKRGQQGVVWVEIWLDANGNQTQTVITKSSGLEALDESALAAVTDWQFKPHQIQGQAIASRVRVPIEFSLQ